MRLMELMKSQNDDCVEGIGPCLPAKSGLRAWGLEAVISQRTCAQGLFMRIISYLRIRCSKLISFVHIFDGSKHSGKLCEI